MEENYPAQPFNYEYGGADSFGRHFAKTESKDEAGVVKGKYNDRHRCKFCQEILIFPSLRGGEK